MGFWRFLRAREGDAELAELPRLRFALAPASSATNLAVGFRCLVGRAGADGAAAGAEALAAAAGVAAEEDGN